MTWSETEFVEYEYRVLHDGTQIYRGINTQEAVDTWRSHDKSVLQRRRIGPWENAQ